MTASALDDVLVLDLSAAVSGAFAGKLLADLGAQVVMVEPPAGTALRQHGLFDYFVGRQGVASSRPTPPSSAPWLAAADVVLTDGSSPWHGVAVDGRADATVLVDVSPFGRSGPYAEWASSDLVTWAMGGYLYFTGSPDREPIWVPGPAGPAARRVPTPRSPRSSASTSASAAGGASASRSPTSTPRSPPTPGWCRRGRRAGCSSSASPTTSSGPSTAGST